jgi:DNA-binding response OmpR family regulator
MQYVLLVNDCADALQREKESLQRSGFVVMSATLVEQAQQRASVVSPDVLICHLSENGACDELARAIQYVLSALT